MLKQQAIDGAKRAAAESGVPIFVVEAPIEVRSADEHEEGPYAYGPAHGLEVIYGYGVVCAVVYKSGKVVDKTPAYPVDRVKWEAIAERETWESDPH